MQTGFALLEAGIAQANSVKTVLLKNFLDFGVSTLLWWLFGYAIATSQTDNIAFSERSSYARMDYAAYLLACSFCTTSVTIVSGGILGRMEVHGYVIFSAYMSVVIYPALSLWAWDSSGFLYQLGYLDFAGSGVVHVTGGICALVGSAMIGPRSNRFRVNTDGIVTVREFGKHSSSLAVTGVWILLFAWLSFNSASVGENTLEGFVVSSRGAANTLTAFGTGAMVGLFINLARKEHNLSIVINSVLAGLVAITGPCVYIDSWATIVISMCGALVTHGCSILMVRLKVDDPVDAFAVHAGAGCTGLLLTGIFVMPELIPSNRTTNDGLVYSGEFHLLGVQLLGCVVIISWSLVLSIAFFAFMKYCTPRLLRIKRDLEASGMDFQFADGLGYPQFTIESFNNANIRYRGDYNRVGDDDDNGDNDNDNNSFKLDALTRGGGGDNDESKRESSVSSSGTIEMAATNISDNLQMKLSTQALTSSQKPLVSLLLHSNETLSNVLIYLKFTDIIMLHKTGRRINVFLSDNSQSMGLWGALLQRDFHNKITGVISESTLVAARSQYRLFYREMLNCNTNWDLGKPINQGSIQFASHIQEYAVAGHIAVIGSFNGTLKVGDINTGTISDPFPEFHTSNTMGHAAVKALHISEDCSTIISGSGLLPWMVVHGDENASSFRATIKVWKMPQPVTSMVVRGEWACFATFQDFQGSVRQVGYFRCDPASKLFENFRSRFTGNELCWSSSDADEVRIWDVACGVCRHTIKFNVNICQCALIRRSQSRDDPPVLMCICTSSEQTSLIMIDLIYGYVLSRANVSRGSSQFPPTITTSGTHFMLAHSDFVSLCRLEFSSQSEIIPSLQQCESSTNNIKHQGWGVNDNNNSLTECSTSKIGLVSKIITAEISAAAGSGTGARCHQDRGTNLLYFQKQVIYVEQLCRKIIDNAVKCAYLDMQRHRCAMVLTTGSLQV